MRIHAYLPPCAALLLSCIALPASAQWATKGEVGLVVASGNTETKSGNVKLALGYKVADWAHTGSFAAVYAADDIGTTAQRWELGEQSQYAFSPRNFWFGALRYEDDRFSGFDYQGTLSTGVGHKFIDTQDTSLSGQLGVGYKVAETRIGLDPVTGLIVPAERSTALAGMGGIDFKHEFNAATSLTDKFAVESTSANTFLQNQIALEVKMTTRIALALAYAVRHNTDPPAGFSKTDTLTTINIVYATE
jgi:putative salt-induced outer membrane protein